MELTDYISNDTITTNSNKTIEQILNHFNDITYSHLPVVNQGKLTGNVSKEDLLAIDDKTQRLSELDYLYEFFFAKETDTLLELFSNFAVNNSDVLPVVSQNNNYVGYLDLNDLLDCFADTPFLKTEGNIILLEKNSKEYAMSEVCQIVESNGNRILGCFVFDQTEESTKITLKVKSLNINELIQSFRRYDYTILNQLTEDSFLESLKRRSEYFIKYINI